MNDEHTVAKRIVIIGTSGSGKTLLGSKLAKALHLNFLDLDEFNWLPDWKQRGEEDFLECIKNQVSYEKWVVSGNYSRTQKYIWPKADIIIWLDFPLYICLWRAFKRSVFRILFRKECCNGNYETLGRLFGNDSILSWVWNSHSRRKREYEALLLDEEYSSRFVRLTNNKEVDLFVHKFENQGSIKSENVK